MVDPTTEVVQLKDYWVRSSFPGNLSSLNIPLADDSPFYNAWVAGLEDQVTVLLNRHEVEWYELTAALQSYPLRPKIELKGRVGEIDT